MYNRGWDIEQEQIVMPKRSRMIPARRVASKRSLQILFVDESRVPPVTVQGNVVYTTLADAPLLLTRTQPDLILVSAELGSEFGKSLTDLKSYGNKHLIPFVLYSRSFSKLNQNIALKFDFDEYYFGEITKEFSKRVRFYKKLKEYRIKNTERTRTRQWCSRKVNFLKRAIDLAVSLFLLVMLSPVFVVIAVLIKLESRGPVFYISKRAGFGYRIFNFYKFRSMRVNADKELEILRRHNQYGNSAFFKMRNDPRVTRLGSFLRSTSLDELPQLINVLKGDMSLVGNRPLPLYEAKLLTKDKTAGRFLAPAGITGLWQITKRGKNEVTESDRISLDISYANNWSVWYDFKILFRTLPALLQKEPV